MTKYEKLNEILYDNNNIISKIKEDSYSIFDDEEISTYFLYNYIDENDDYSHFNACKDIYITLVCLNNGHDLNTVFSKNYYSQPTSEIYAQLIENNFIETDSSSDIDVSCELSKLNSSQLQELLKKYGIKASGKRKKLIKLSEDKIPKSEFDSTNPNLTSKAEKFLKDYEWIRLHEFALSKFDFMDYCKYINENEGKTDELTIDFINLHIKNANNSKNLIYLDYCFKSKGLFYIFRSDFENALNSELKQFILRLNPSYSYFGYYAEYLIFDPENIHYIKICMEKLNIEDVEDIFNNVWDSLNLKREYLSKNTAYNFLKRSFEEDLDSLSNEYNDKYFESPQEYAHWAKEYYKYHEYVLSSDVAEFALDIDSEMEEVLFTDSLSLMHRNDFEWALKSIDEALDINSQNGKYWALKAIINFKTNNTDSAIKYFKKALKLNPNDSFILNSIGVCYNYNNKTDDAIKYFKKAITSSDDIYPKLNLAKIHIKNKNWDNAEEYFNDIEKTSFQSADYLIEKGCYYLIKRDYENALNCFNNCIDNYYSGIEIFTLKYLSLKELGNEKLYKQFKNKLNVLDLKFVKNLEKYLKN